MNRDDSLSVVIPTFQREEILLNTLEYLSEMNPAPDEIILIDQTAKHKDSVEEKLYSMTEDEHIRWIRLSVPSIPHAMNIGLLEARGSIVLFLDDDIIPDKNLIKAHALAHKEGYLIVAGQVLQPGEEPITNEKDGIFRFCSNRRQLVNEFIGCNFSVKRGRALTLGGFDENFIHVAYRYENEFADRAIFAGEKILFEPAASIRHLKAERGGTRSYGKHLRTIKPSHSVGEYYYLLRAVRIHNRMRKMIGRPFRAISTRHHLHNPWWIPVALVAELLGFFWAVLLYMKGPLLIRNGKAPDGRI